MRSTASWRQTSPIQPTTGSDEAVFEFSVPLSWLADQGLTVRDIVLMRYHNGVWTALPTELIGESGNEARYRATSPGFSYFAIVTEKNGPLLRVNLWVRPRPSPSLLSRRCGHDGPGPWSPATVLSGRAQQF